MICVTVGEGVIGLNFLFFSCAFCIFVLFYEDMFVVFRLFVNLGAYSRLDDYSRNPISRSSRVSLLDLSKSVT